MGNSLRCCLACVLPCGALDLIRIVHLNGRVEEYGRPVSAGEVLAAHPNHVLSKPCSQGVAVRRILIVAPDSELERGEIYFLIPAASVPQEKKPAAAKSQRQRRQESLSRGDNDGRRLVSKTAAASCDDDGGKTGRRRPSNPNKSDLSSARKKPGGSAAHRRRTSAGSRTAVWKPHLECIVEDT